MSTYQIVIRSTASAFPAVSVAAFYERFLNWWVSLYANPPRNPRPLI
jgi:hypothetical protein